jgi:3-dehydroquinate synthase
VTTINVALAERAYDVHVGRGLLPRVAELADLPPSAAVLLVTQGPVARHHAEPVRSALHAAGHHVQQVEVPDGEAAKSPDVLALLWKRAAEMPLTRRDAVVALGGGVVGDLAGFLAATWNRGIDVVQVPTTLLAQVDAAIGGKTGINLPQGKNLVGAFHQPRTVIADLDTLRTLTARVRREGLGEVVKAGLIRDPRILELIETDPHAAATADDDRLVELVKRSVAVKAAVVAADEREAGERAHLNLGHTLAHGVETCTDHAVLHGEAVAMGTVAALRLGVALGTTPPEVAERGEAALAAVGLPTRLPPMDRATLWQVLARDKKADRGMRFVLLEDLARPVLQRVDRAPVDAIIDELTDERVLDRVLAQT